MDMDQIFCSNQIATPPILPSVLKKYAKAAIRTQPYDLLVWSAAYFRAMAKGTTPPVKPRLEFPLPEHRQLTLGYVKLLIYQFGRSGEVSREDLTQKWNDVCLPSDILYNVLRLGCFAHTVDWEKFVAITVAFLEQTLKGTMLRICELITEEPEGGSAMIPCHTFLSIYNYLGKMECGIAETTHVSAAAPASEKQPCLPYEQDEGSLSGRDIDSVIREIGDVESSVSVDTRLEGEGLELDWPNLETKSESELALLRFPSEPSDMGATSRYGIEVMAGADAQQRKALDSYKATKVEVEEVVTGEDGVPQQTKGEIKVLYAETKTVLLSEKDSEISGDAEIDKYDDAEKLAASMSIHDLLPTDDNKTLDQLMEQAIEEAKETQIIELDEESEVGSDRVIIKEKEGEESPSERDSQFSEIKKSLGELDDPGKTLQKSMSLIDVRPTLDRNLRRKMLDDAILGEEKRKIIELQAEAEAREKQRIEEEAKEKFHLHVPGIGPTLPEDLMNKVEVYMKCCAERQANMVMPRNIRHFLCPPLDLESLVQTKELTSLLDEVTPWPEFKEPSIMPRDLIEVIQRVSDYDLESTLDSSMTPRSAQQSFMAFKELSNVSEQVQPVTQITSLHFLLNHEK